MLRVNINLYNAKIMHWTKKLHKLLLDISDLVNRHDLDARLMAASDVQIDRALYPLLSRIELHGDLSGAELANLVGRDESTVSRQLAKLEGLGLITRSRCSQDRRIFRLQTSPAGKRLTGRLERVRRRWMERYFSDWTVEDRDRLMELMGIMMKNGENGDASAHRRVPEILSDLARGDTE